MSRVETDSEQRSRTSPVVIENGRIVTPTEVVEGGVLIEGDRIVAVDDGVADEAEGEQTRIDADGRYVLPGLIDLHGDDIEKHLFPRSNTRMTTPMALTAADRANVASGITTKFHAVAFKDDPEDDRSTGLAEEVAEAVDSADWLVADHRIHARCEVSEAASVRAVRDVIDRGHPDLVSVMCHVPGKGQFSSVDAFLEYHKNSEKHDYERAKERVRAAREVDDAELRTNVDAIVDHALSAGVPVASHDDEHPAEVERLHERGVRFAEYPVTMDAARRAADLGMTTAMGAPNLISGGSQWGNLATAAAIGAGVVDVLCADYHPPSLLAAPFVETGEFLPERVARVTANPADAVGLAERGRIEVGARADLIVVDVDPTPRVCHAVTGGCLAYRAGGGR